MARGHRWRLRLTRDLVLFSTALSLGSWEVVFGGAKPEALTFCLSLLLSPLVMRYDEQRRNRDDRDDR